MPIDPQAVIDGHRRSLAKAITLVESSLPAHRSDAQSLLETLLPKTGNSIRIGISGVPGVGKSTFIENFGRLLIERGKRLAVLAIDPSSPLAGGSILGDKTRMETLAREENVFIRPSPTGGALGGVAQKTRESVLLCEAAGYDVILIETVGVGQSEFLVAGMVDFFMLLMLPGGGDELQGIKKGIVELAHAIVINKSDGDGAGLAANTQTQYQSALNILRQDGAWQPQVLRCSALEKTGLTDVWAVIQQFVEQSKSRGDFDTVRAEQNRSWMHQLVQELLLERVRSDSAVAEELPSLELAVANGSKTPLAAAQQLLSLLDHSADSL